MSSPRPKSEPIRHGYAILRAVTDGMRNKTATVGVVAWDADAGWFGIRVIHEGERVPGVTAGVRGLAQIAAHQLRWWSDERRVPYAHGRLEPWDSEFWVAASLILTTVIRLDAPRSMDPMKDRDNELELLFEALAQPLVSASRRTSRIDGAISKALGGVAGWLRTGLDLPAFRGKTETVLRGAVGPNAAVVVEGVNLAASNARKEADALVSKLLRIREGASDLRIVVGYVASPGGLNGESDMRDWIATKITKNVYDVVSDEVAFRQAALDELHSIGLSSEPQPAS